MSDAHRAGGTRALVGGMPVTARRLASLGNLTSEDFKVLGGLKGRTIKAGTLLNAAGGGADAPSLILSGWCARVASSNDGRQQITGILLPGDSFNLGSAPWAGDELRVLTLTSSVVVDATPLSNLIRLRSPGHSRLIEACHRLAWLEQTYALNHIIRLAGRDAYRKVAHFIVEIHDRLSEVGLVHEGAFATPIAQPVVAEALGLSGVHLNRITRKLRVDALVDFPRGVVHVLDRDRLAEVSGYDSCVSWMEP